MGGGDINVDELIGYVRAHPGVTQRELAQRSGMSERTVRTRVARANTRLAGCARIVHTRRAGYALEVSDARALERALQRGSAADVPGTPRERRVFLITYLMARNGWTTLAELSARLFVSRATLSKDLARCRPYLASYGLELETRPRYGMRVTGPEVMRRTGLVLLITEYARTPRGPAALALECAAGAPRPPEEVYRIAREAIDEVAERQGARINTLPRETIYAHACVSALRAGAGADLAREPGDSTAIRQFGSYPIARAMTAEISRRLGWELSDEEAVYLAVHLGARLILDESDAFVTGSSHVLHHVREAADEIARRMRDAFDIDITHDEGCLGQLLAYLAPLAARLRYHVELRNKPDDAAVFEHYDRAYAIAQMAAEVVARRFAGPPSDAEVYNLTLMFALMLTRLGKTPVRKRIVVVYHQSPAMGRLLALRLEDAFSCYIASVETCEYRALDTLDLSRVDLVVATAPLGRELPVPVRVSSVFFDEADASAVGDAIRP